MEIAPDFTDAEWKARDLTRDDDWLRVIEAALNAGARIELQMIAVKP